MFNPSKRYLILVKKPEEFEEFGCCDEAKSSITLACCNADMGLPAGCCSKEPQSLLYWDLSPNPLV